MRAVGNDLTALASQLLSDADLCCKVESQRPDVLNLSDSVLRRVITAEALDQDAEFAGRPSLLRGLIATLGLGSAISAADRTLTALTALRRSLVVKRAERTYVVDVGVTSTYPEKAARIANGHRAGLSDRTNECPVRCGAADFTDGSSPRA